MHEILSGFRADVRPAGNCLSFQMTSFRRPSVRPINSSTPDSDEPIQLESPSLIESEANVMPRVGRGRGNRNRGLTPALVVVVGAAGEWWVA